MPRFLDRDGRFGVSAGYKVMSSSLAAHDHLVEVDEATFARALRQAPRPHLLLTRHPKPRLVSAFRDKFRAQPMLFEEQAWQGWQRIHQVHYRWLGLKDDDSDDRKIEAFLDLSWERFVELLPRTKWFDGHLRPQYLQERIRVKRLLPIGSAKVTAVRDIADLDPEEMQRDWGIDVAARRNVVGSREAASDFPEADDPLSDDRIRKAYATDYRRYGYD